MIDKRKIRIFAIRKITNNKWFIDFNLLKKMTCEEMLILLFQIKVINKLKKLFKKYKNNDIIDLKDELNNNSLINELNNETKNELNNDSKNELNNVYKNELNNNSLINEFNNDSKNELNNVYKNELNNNSLIIELNNDSKNE